jgi:VanZ family protein
MKILRFWFPLVLYSVMIFCVSSWPGAHTYRRIFHYDKILHIIEYIPFGFFGGRALHKSFFPIRFKAVGLGVLVMALLYGLSDEWHQSFVPGRSASIYDVAADLIGALGGCYLYFWIHNKRKKNS